MKEYLENLIGIVSYENIILSIIWFAILVLIRKVIHKLLFKYLGNDSKYYKHKKRVHYIVLSIYGVILFSIWGNIGNGLSTYIGLLSAGIAIALKDPLVNVVSWIVILFTKPFVVGNRIFIHGVRGDVIDITTFEFSLMETLDPEDGGMSTGRIIQVPNYYIFLHPLTNYSKGFEYIWSETDVLLTFESDWKKAKEELLDIVNKHGMKYVEDVEKDVKSASKHYMIHYSKFTPIVYTDVKDSGIQLTLRYIVKNRYRRNIVNDIWEDILDMCEKNGDIELAYPTYRIVK